MSFPSGKKIKINNKTENDILAKNLINDLNDSVLVKKYVLQNTDFKKTIA